jgi:hypothetical protein
MRLIDARRCAKERQMRGEWTAATTRTVDLGYDQLLVLESRPGMKVRVLYGNLWLTEEGAMQDVFAGSGTEVALKAHGRAVIEGLGTARVEVVEPRGPAVFAQLARWIDLRSLYRRLRGFAHALAARLSVSRRERTA